MLGPLVVLEVWLVVTATDQLIVAFATLIIAIAGLLPAVLTVWSHVVQQRQLTGNAAKLDRIDTSTNGAVTALRAENDSLRAALAKLAPPGPSQGH